MINKIKEKLKEDLSIAQRATPGPWCRGAKEHGITHLVQVGTSKWSNEAFVVINDDEASNHNMEFIAHSRNEFEKYIKAVEIAVEVLEHDFRCSLPATAFPKHEKPKCPACVALSEIAHELGVVE